MNVMPKSAQVSVTELIKRLGADIVLADEQSRAFFSTDVYRAGQPPLAVVQPKSVEDVRKAVAAARDLKLAIFARGGGASYTDAYTPNTLNSILVDTSTLNRIVAINEEDMFVTVEPGVTWEQLEQALKPKGLRTPFWGPFSGIAATVGGSMSQNSLSHGSGIHGISAESVISFDVVLANGEILSTGSASHVSAPSPFYRFAGPDLTALFTGDAGALGLKVAITIRLIRERAAKAAESFSFKTFASMKNAMAEVAREGIADENFALDPALQEGQIARQDTGAMLKTAWQVFRGSKNPVNGAITVGKMGLAGRNFLDDGAYSAHFLVDGVDATEVRARVAALRRICMQYGVVIPNTVPTVVQSMPFAPLFNILGPRGERWVPVHGVLPFSLAEPFHEAWTKLIERERNHMDAHKVTLGGMFSTISTNAFLYEIAFYWQDERSVYHNTMLPEEHLQAIPAYEPSESGRAYMDELKTRTVELFQTFGAVHFQLGKAYPFMATRTPIAGKLMRDIKSMVDPDNMMNPGALGLS
jgi:glycolate dehydrogenase FAD-linked subunit